MVFCDLAWLKVWVMGEQMTSQWGVTDCLATNDQRKHGCVVVRIPHARHASQVSKEKRNKVVPSTSGSTMSTSLLVGTPLFNLRSILLDIASQKAHHDARFRPIGRCPTA
jgi:hypothetical protein